MSELFGLLWGLSTLLFFISLIILIVKAIRKKPKRKLLKLMGICFLAGGVFSIGSVFSAPSTYEASYSSDSAVVAESTTNINEGSYKYSGDDLRKLYYKYMDTKKDSHKNKLRQANPEELYQLIVNDLKEEYLNYGIDTSGEHQYFKDACLMFVEINGSFAGSADLKNIANYADQIYAGHQELGKLKTKYGSDVEEYLINFSYQYDNVDFYIAKKLETAYNDTITGKIMKEIDSHQAKRTQYLATLDYTYNPILGYMSGDNYCVVQPLQTFSQEGIYTLTVRQEGTTTLVNSRGFETEVPVYLELSETYINTVYADLELYFAIYDEIAAAEVNLATVLPGIL